MSEWRGWKEEREKGKENKREEEHRGRTGVRRVARDGERDRERREMESEKTCGGGRCVEGGREGGRRR